MESKIMRVNDNLVIDFGNKTVFIKNTTTQDAYLFIKQYRISNRNYLMFVIDGLFGEYVSKDGKRDGNGCFHFDGNLSKGWKYTDNKRNR